MSVARYDLTGFAAALLASERYVVFVAGGFRFDEAAKKSVIAYPENCQSCGQCYVNCLGRSLTIVNDMYGYAQTSYRAATTVAMNRTAQKVIDR